VRGIYGIVSISNGWNQVEVAAERPGGVVGRRVNSDLVSLDQETEEEVSSDPTTAGKEPAVVLGNQQGEGSKTTPT